MPQKYWITIRAQVLFWMERILVEKGYNSYVAAMVIVHKLLYIRETCFAGVNNMH
jgi:hypothetical protein